MTQRNFTDAELQAISANPSAYPREILAAARNQRVRAKQQAEYELRQIQKSKESPYS